LSLVIDNSVVLAWCFDDERTPALMAVLDKVEAAGAVAPQLWPLEASNALLVAERRGRIGADDRTSLLRFLADLPIAIDSETAARAWVSTAALAQRHDLTAYDAAYLELALRLGLPLATRDRALIAAATRLGLEVLPSQT
jgi:predicted nucleic acid-binding protein